MNRYVREVKNRRWQARIWLNGTYGHINLGCFDTAKEAHDASKEFLRHGLTAFMKDGTLPEGVLPRFVRAAAGDVYTARLCIQGQRFRVGRYLWPEVAHDAMQRLLRRAFPRGRSRSKRKRLGRPASDFKLARKIVQVADRPLPAVTIASRVGQRHRVYPAEVTVERLVADIRGGRWPSLRFKFEPPPEPAADVATIDPVPATKDLARSEWLDSPSPIGQVV